MDIELVTDPDACMMYTESPLAGLGGAYCGGLPPTACYGRTLSERPCYILPLFFIGFFMAALVGQTAERIFTKLSHVVDIRHRL